jgi:UDP-glucose 4-epimerase
MGLFLVTGGCGFIGSHLVDALIVNGHSVRVLDDLSTGRRSNIPENIEVHIGSISDAEAVNKALAGVDGCYHLAAVSSVEASMLDWAGGHQVNLTGTINVFECASRQLGGPIPVVYASSAAVYADVSVDDTGGSSEIDDGGPRLSEHAALMPTSPYGADKLGCEYHALIAARTFGVPTFGLRLFNVYGPRDRPESPSCGVVSIFAQMLMNGTSLPVFGDGVQVRDFIFVSDVVQFLQCAMDRIDSGSVIVNVCTGVGVSILDLIDTLHVATGIAPTVQSCSLRPGEIRASTGDPSWAAEVLGLRAEVGLLSGIRQTVDWLETCRCHIEPSDTF